MTTAINTDFDGLTREELIAHAKVQATIGGIKPKPYSAESLMKKDLRPVGILYLVFAVCCWLVVGFGAFVMITFTML